MSAGTQGGVVRTVTRVVTESCKREGLFPAGSRALVMVSGGQDSLALLDLLATKAIGTAGPAEVHALHVNHHLRAAESERDEESVGRHCARLGVRLTVVDGTVEKAAGNVQESAREVRRRAALDAALEFGCDRIALGHTMDDQAETLLYRVARYGGLAALRGMLPNDPPWVRPLLGLRRIQTEAYCRERGLEFVVDRGNAYPGYARTGLRERVLPAWEEVLPGAAEAAARTAEVAAEAESLLTLVVRDTGIDVSAGRQEVDRLRALAAPLRRLILYAWLDDKDVTPTRKDVLSIEGLLASGGTAVHHLGKGRRVVREYDTLYMDGPGGDPMDKAPIKEGASVLTVPGSVSWGGSRVSAVFAERFRAPDPTLEAYIDAAAITEGLEVRGPRPGDRIRPLGLGGTRKLQDVFTDLKVPAARRPFVPLVVCADTILWVCGLVCAERGRISADTKQLVRLSVERE